MMEVKQHTAKSFGNLLSSNVGDNDDDDAVMENLKHREHNTNLETIKTNGVPTKLTNGDTNIAVTIADNDDNDVAMVDLEAAAKAIPAEKDSVNEEKTETTSQGNPGDDLDKLLSKINDIVEDCTDDTAATTSVNKTEDAESTHDDSSCIIIDSSAEESFAEDLINGTVSKLPAEALSADEPAKAMPAEEADKIVLEEEQAKAMLEQEPAKVITTDESAKAMPAEEADKIVLEEKQAKAISADEPAKDMPLEEPAEPMPAKEAVKTMIEEEPAEAMLEEEPAKTVPAEENVEGEIKIVNNEKTPEEELITKTDDKTTEEELITETDNKTIEENLITAVEVHKNEKKDLIDNTSSGSTTVENVAMNDTPIQKLKDEELKVDDIDLEKLAILTQGSESLALIDICINVEISMISEETQNVQETTNEKVDDISAEVSEATEVSNEKKEDAVVAVVDASNGEVSTSAEIDEKINETVEIVPGKNDVICLDNEPEIATTTSDETTAVSAETDKKLQSEATKFAVGEVTAAKKPEQEIIIVTLDDDEDEMFECNENTTKEKLDKEKENVKESDTSTPAEKPAALSVEAADEDSDDEIIFFVDQPPEEDTTKKNASNDTKDKKKENSDKNEATTELQAPMKTETVTKINDKGAALNDDDVVFLVDDDEDDADVAQRLPVKEKCSDSEAAGNEPTTTLIREETTKDDSKSTSSNKEKLPISTINEIEQLNRENGNKNLNLIADNSDNACDEFAEKNKEEDKAKIETEEDAGASKQQSANSVDNCSNSSNLLQESKGTNLSHDVAVAEENDDDEMDGENDDVEIVEDICLADDAEQHIVDKEAPPAKRIRLSADSNESNAVDLAENKSTEKPSSSVAITESSKSGSNSQDGLTNSTTTNSAAVKRSRESLLENDVEKRSADDAEMTETPNKKHKTEQEDSSNVPKAGDAQIASVKCVKDDGAAAITTDNITEACDASIVKTKDEATVLNDCSKDEVAAACNDVQMNAATPIALYPPPKFNKDALKQPLNLEYFKRFRKSYEKLTKSDLEDLVLQKIVEALVYKSEFAEMREIIEKQEKIITAHRSRINDLSKQFRDLEMVHNRVIKDIEQKNSHFIMPVKITRAVGLQVCVPSRRSLDAAEQNSTNHNTLPHKSPVRVAIAAAQTTTTLPTAVETTTTNTTSTPLSALQRQLAATDAATATVSSSSNIVSSRPSGALVSAAALATGYVRRGCVQKITPQRPVDSSAFANRAAAVTVTAAQHMPPRVLNTKVQATATATSGNRYSGTAPQVRAQTQQQKYSTPRQPANMIRKILPKQNAHSQPQQAHNQTAQQVLLQRRAGSDQLTAASSASTSAASTPQSLNKSNPAQTIDSYMASLNNKFGSGSLSITPAKPKDKAFIDLTDEDDILQSLLRKNNALTATTTVRTRLPTAASNSSSSSPATSLHTNVRQTPPLARLHTPNSAVISKQRQLSNSQAQKANNFSGSSGVANLTSPTGTSIQRIVPNIGNARNKYGHPAPLPPTPAQTYIPQWKMPPARPTIRISNIESGIVISWTMEEPLERHAESVSYQIYAYQETSGPALTESWRHVGDVKAMLLPMAVTLTQFQEGQRYYFAVRAADQHQRFGPFSMPKTWL